MKRGSSTGANSPTSGPTSRSTAEKYTFGAEVEVKENGKFLTMLRTSRRFFRPTGAAATGGLADYFAGEATTEVGLKTGPIRDIWVTVAPNVQAVQHQLALAEKGFEKVRRSRAGDAAPVQTAQRADAGRRRRTRRCEPKALEQIESLQLLSAEKIALQYVTSSSAATFKVIINPLVLWMWIGGIIGLIGALIAVWPSRSRRKGAMVRTEADELKEAKYREIRDAELDHASGKLSDQDYAILDAELRKEAVEILDAVGVGAGGGATARAGPRRAAERLGRRRRRQRRRQWQRPRRRQRPTRQRPCSRRQGPTATATVTRTATARTAHANGTATPTASNGNGNGERPADETADARGRAG